MVIVVVVNLVNAFRAPLVGLLPQRLIIGQQGILSAADDFVHIAQRLGVAVFVVLIHHHLGIHHVGKGLGHAALGGIGGLHRQCAAGHGLLQIGDDVGIHLVGRQLRCQVVAREVGGEEWDVTPELPQVHVVIGPQYPCLGGVIQCLGLGHVALARGLCVGHVGYDVVTTLHAAILVYPQRGQRVVGVGRVVGHELPEEVIRRRSATHVDIVGHDVRTDVDGIVAAVSPVGPVQWVVGCHHGLLQVGVGEVVFVNRVCRWVLFLQEAIATAGQCHRSHGHQSQYQYILCFHNCHLLLGWLERKVESHGPCACLGIYAVVYTQ